MPYNDPRRQRGGNACPIMTQGGKEVGMFALYWPEEAKKWECLPYNGPRSREMGMFAL